MNDTRELRSSRRPMAERRLRCDTARGHRRRPAGRQEHATGTGLRSPVEDDTEEAPCLRDGRGRGPRRQRDGALCPEPTLRHGPGPTPHEEPPWTSGSSGPSPAGSSMDDTSGMWSVDPAAPADPATSVELTSDGVIPLGWSSDGTRLLAMRRDGGSARQAAVHPERRWVGDAGDGAADEDSRRSDRSRRVARRVRGSPETPEGMPRPGRCTPLTPMAARPMLGVSRRHPGRTCILSRRDSDRVRRRRGRQQPPCVGDRRRRRRPRKIVFDGAPVTCTASRGHQLLVQIALRTCGNHLHLRARRVSLQARDQWRGMTRTGRPTGCSSRTRVSCLADAAGCGLAIADADGSNVVKSSSGASGPWHRREAPER